MTKNYYQVKEVKRGWTKLPNAILHDEKLTSDAKVIIFELLSVSGEYHISITGISSTVHLSVERVKKAIKLLKEVGYLQVDRVKNGTQFGGCVWRIADINGKFLSDNPHKGNSHKTENPSAGNPNSREIQQNGNPSDGKPSSMETQQMGNPPIYKDNEIYEELNIIKEIYEQPIDEPLTHQPLDGVGVRSSDIKSSFSPSSSSGAEAPSHSKNPPQQGDAEVISSEEYLFRKFLDKYPKAPLSRELDITRKAFYEIPGLEIIFDEIMAGLDAWIDSAEWNRDGGRWIKKPLNFIRERQWEKVNLATESAANKEIEMLALKMSSSWSLEDNL